MCRNVPLPGKKTGREISGRGHPVSSHFSTPNLRMNLCLWVHPHSKSPGYRLLSLQPSKMCIGCSSCRCHNAPSTYHLPSSQRIKRFFQRIRDYLTMRYINPHLIDLIDSLLHELHELKPFSWCWPTGSGCNLSAVRHVTYLSQIWEGQRFVWDTVYTAFNRPSAPHAECGKKYVTYVQ